MQMKALERRPARLFSNMWNTHQFVVDPTKFTVEDVLGAKFYSDLNNPSALQVMDIIHAVAADHSWDLEARLVMKRPGEMKFNVLRLTKTKAVEQPEISSGDFLVKHHGFGRYRVVERSTGKVLADGLDKATADIERRRLEDTRKAA